MRVRAKFRCVNIEDYKQVSGPGMEPLTVGGTVTLEPVIGGSPENEQFFRYTPSGKITLSTVNLNALGEFYVGQEYFVDFWTPQEATERSNTMSQLNTELIVMSEQLKLQTQLAEERAEEIKRLEGCVTQLADEAAQLRGQTPSPPEEPVSPAEPSPEPASSEEEAAG